MKVLSLFDGISCARVALGDVVEYYASEIDKHAIKIAKKNFPPIVHLGDVKEVGLIPDLDLLIGGSPCQDLSIAKKGREGLKGERSGLFYEYVRIWKLNKPKWFILENVASMPKEAKDEITKEMGVEPIMINASLVSAQCRKRLFWTNIPVKGLPEDKGIMLKDILESEVVSAPMGKIITKKNRTQQHVTKKLGYIGIDHQANRVYSDEAKSPAINTLGANGLIKLGYYGKGGANNQGGQAYRIYSPEGKSVTLGSAGAGLIKTETIRKLTPIECERLQCLPDNYTEGISNTQRYKCLGNAFNVDVIRFILSFI